MLYLYCIFAGGLVQAVGEKHHHEGTKLIFDGLQSPKLNKQVKDIYSFQAAQEYNHSRKQAAYYLC